MLCEGTDGGVRTGICRAVETGEATGELPPDFPERVTAAIIVTYLQGFFRLVKVLKSREEMEQEIESLMVRLGL